MRIAAPVMLPACAYWSERAPPGIAEGRSRSPRTQQSCGRWSCAGRCETRGRPRGRSGAAAIIPTLTLEAVIAWLDTGQPDPDHAANRIDQAIQGVIQAALAG